MDPFLITMAVSTLLGLLSNVDYALESNATRAHNREQADYYNNVRQVVSKLRSKYTSLANKVSDSNKEYMLNQNEINQMNTDVNQLAGLIPYFTGPVRAELNKTLTKVSNAISESNRKSQQLLNSIAENEKEMGSINAEIDHQNSAQYQPSTDPVTITEHLVQYAKGNSEKFESAKDNLWKTGTLKSKYPTVK